MTDDELNTKRKELAARRRAMESMPAMAAMGTAKNAALLAAEITDELARRELERSRKEADQ